MTAVRIKNTRAMGDDRMGRKLPSVRIRERRTFSSSRGARMNPTTMGASGYSQRLRIYPTSPKMTMTSMSKIRLLAENEPTKQHAITTGSR